MKAGDWTWLELAKIIAGLLTPLTVAAIGIYIHRITKRFEHSQWRSQKLIEKRLSIYDDLAPQLNSVLCYFLFIGDWRELSPPEVVAMKRKIDKKIYLAAPLFSDEFFSSCMAFQSACFHTYNGWGKAAQLKTSYKRRIEASGDDWNPQWLACFSSVIADTEVIKAAYSEAIKVISRDIGVSATFSVPSPGKSPSNH
jgi:hypothetical protein